MAGRSLECVSQREILDIYVESRTVLVGILLLLLLEGMELADFSPTPTQITRTACFVFQHTALSWSGGNERR